MLVCCRNAGGRKRMSQYLVRQYLYHPYHAYQHVSKVSKQTRRQNLLPLPGVARTALLFSHVARSVVCFVTWQAIIASFESAVQFHSQFTEIILTPLSKLIRYENQRKGSRLNFMKAIQLRLFQTFFLCVLFHALLGFMLFVRFPSYYATQNRAEILFSSPFLNTVSKTCY